MVVLRATPYTRLLVQPEPVRPWLPEGQLLLRDAIHLLGQATFGDVWTGEELHARYGAFGPPRPPREPESRGPLSVKLVDGTQHQIENPVRYVVDGRLEFLPYEDALQRFEDEKDELFGLWQEEKDAFHRYVDTCDENRRVLHAGRVSANILTKAGHAVPVPTRIWSGRYASKVLNTGLAKFDDSRSYTTITEDGIVMVPERELEMYLKGFRAEDDATTTAPIESAVAKAAAKPPEETQYALKKGRRWSADQVGLGRLLARDLQDRIRRRSPGNTSGNDPAAPRLVCLKYWRRTLREPD